MIISRVSFTVNSPSRVNVPQCGVYKTARIIIIMMNPKNDRVIASDAEKNNDEEASREPTEENESDSAEGDYKRDESNRGERPDNLRRRADWFQKRTGGG